MKRLTILTLSIVLGLTACTSLPTDETTPSDPPSGTQSELGDAADAAIGTFDDETQDALGDLGDTICTSIRDDGVAVAMTLAGSAASSTPGISAEDGAAAVIMAVQASCPEYLDELEEWASNG